MPDQRKFSPASARNSAPLVAVLAERLPARGQVLEIASGTGQNVVAFAEAFPGITWQPSEPDPVLRASIAAWTRETGVSNVAPPLDIDVRDADWQRTWPDGFDAIFVANLVHITPWETTLGLLRGAGDLLEPGGPLMIYGCFKRGGAHISESNVAFDAGLRRENPRWGVRDVSEVADAAAARGLDLAEAMAMPANNLTLVLRRSE